MNRVEAMDEPLSEPGPMGRLVLGYLALLVVVELPFAFGALSLHQLARYSALYPSATLPLTALVTWRAGRSARSVLERRFWALLAAAWLPWWLVELSDLLTVEAANGRAYALGRDALFALFYLLFLAAAGVEPHREQLDSFRPVRFARWLGLTASVVGLLAYFVVLPQRSAPHATPSWLPVVSIYGIVDLLLGLRFARLARTAAAQSWRRTYALLAGAQGLWAALDLLQGWATLAPSSWIAHPRAEPLWNLPCFLFALALPGRSTRGEHAAEITRAPADLHWFERSPSAVVAVAFPILHITLHEAGALDDALRGRRAALVLLCSSRS
jgi:hypothetical protein